MSTIGEIISFICIILIINTMGMNGDDRVGPKESRGHYALRRLDCQLFCKKTGFSGYVGGCQCGFTLFANKRSESNNIDTNGYFSGNKVNENKFTRIGLKSSFGMGSNRLANDDQSKYYSQNGFPSRPIYGHI